MFIGATETNFKYMGLTLGAIISGWLLSAVFVAILGVILDSIKYPLSWYGSPWIIFGLYCAPTLAISCGSLLVLKHFYVQVCFEILIFL